MSGRDPFEQLTRSHRRLEELLDALQSATPEPDLLRDAAAFFARNVRRHEEDEEQSLFPRLAKHAELAPLLERLGREHREHEALHARLDAYVQELDLGKTPSPSPSPSPSRSQIDALVDALVRAYRDHVDTEERELFPAARAALDDNDLAAMASEMDSRRASTRMAGGGGRRRS